MAGYGSLRLWACPPNGPGIPRRQGDEQEPDRDNGKLQPVGQGPVTVLAQTEPMQSAIDAYKAFDKREWGWIKVGLKPQASAA